MIQQEAVIGHGEAAGFGVRFVAYIIDGIILLIPNLILRLVLGPILGGLLDVVVSAAYVVYFWTSSGATLGKMAMGLKVVSAETGGLIDPGTALLRYVGYIVSGIALGLGFFWIIWDPAKQGWHDKIAKTLVIRAK
ncbi:MAG: RDD family protein [Chloroflexota bacterium]|nr:RDD family protein [Chloroflexota bacterium]